MQLNLIKFKVSVTMLALVGCKHKYNISQISYSNISQMKVVY